ncbi:MAG: LmbE family protein [Methanohalophilus sp.]|nr:MAG: LmbE family protein [Methanohalophilus sp.]
MKILVIAPHPDDETLGCGGTIVKHIVSGDCVTICIVTTAYTPAWSEEFLNIRNNQVNKATTILNINRVIDLGYHTVKLDTIPQKDISESLSNVVKQVNPDIVYIPHKGDLHRDHRVIFESSLVALRPVNCNVKRILAYETLSETEWGQPIEPFMPTSYCDISETFSKKVEALKAYKSELRDYPHPRSVEAIEALAKKRGSEVGFHYAEAFSIIRDVF